MPRGVSKVGSLASAFRKEIHDSVEKALSSSGLATSKEIKDLIQALRSLGDAIKKVPGAPVKNDGAKAAPKKKGRKPKATVCSVKGCDRPHYAKGLCASHYNSALRKKKLAEEKKAGKAAGKKTTKKAKPGPKPKAKKAAKAVKTKAAPKKAAKTCSVKGCNEKHYAKGLCRKHYMAKFYKSKKKSKK